MVVAEGESVAAEREAGSELVENVIAINRVAKVVKVDAA